MTERSAPPDALPAEFAEAFAAEQDALDPLGSQILYYSSVGSTNDVALRLALAGQPEGLVVIAEAQTAGRGRRGRSWFSPPASGLYVSLLLDPGRAGDPARATTLLTIAAGVALAEAIETRTGLAADIKWPNDLHVARRKLAGILAEGVTSSSARTVSSVILGYGINVGRMSYPPELTNRATSLEIELGRSIDRAALCAETLAAMARRYADLIGGRFDAILDAWRQRAPSSRGASVKWQTSTGSCRSGTTAGIDDRGALLVQSGDAIERIVSGEVQWV